MSMSTTSPQDAYTPNSSNLFIREVESGGAQNSDVKAPEAKGKRKLTEQKFEIIREPVNGVAAEIPYLGQGRRCRLRSFAQARRRPTHESRRR